MPPFEYFLTLDATLRKRCGVAAFWRDYKPAILAVLATHSGNQRRDAANPQVALPRDPFLGLLTTCPA